MKTFFLFWLCICAVALAHAQEGFLVYTFQGNVTAVEKGQQEKVTVGRMLDAKTEVVIAPGGAVSLICNQGHLIIINKAGKFPLEQYVKECSAAGSSVTANYLKYIWSQFTQKPGTPEKNRKQYMSNVGAVSRSMNSIWIDPRLDTVNYVTGAFPLSWKSYADESDFEFLLYAANDIHVPILVVPTKKRFIDLTDVLRKAKPAGQYYWTAIVKGGTNDERKLLNVVPQGTYKVFLQQINLSGALPEDEAATAFRTGFLLEQGHYLAQAYEHYRKAARLRPDVTVYTSTLEAFKKDYAVVE